MKGYEKPFEVHDQGVRYRYYPKSNRFFKGIGRGLVKWSQISRDEVPESILTLFIHKVLFGGEL